jgi:hypothetical protein
MSKHTRSIIGSDFLIVWATLIHFFEGLVLLTIYPVPRSVPMASFLSVFVNQTLAGAVLWLAAGMACFAQWCPHKTNLERFLLLIPQAALLFITGFGALYFVAHGQYADGTVRSGLSFILPDQITRIGMPFMYVFAILARLKDGP